MNMKENYTPHNSIPGMVEVRKLLFFFTYTASMKLNKSKYQRAKLQEIPSDY